MVPTVEALPVERLSPLENLARDEELLGRGGPAVRVAVLTGAAVSTGIGRPLGASARGAVDRAGLPALLRGSGGSALLHLPQDLAWAMALPRSHSLAGPGFASAYPGLGEGVVRFLSGEGVSATWAEAFGLSESYCLLGARGRVLAVDGRALGGAAQHLTRSTLLHHGVLPRRVDRPRLETLFGLSPELAGRLVGLEEVGVRAEPLGLAERLLRALVDQLSERSLGTAEPATPTARAPAGTPDAAPHRPD